jgi:8-oxo-dGTP diphosphatase
MSEGGVRHIDVVAAIIFQDERVLVCQRRADAAFPLKWEFPGGKVEPGERFEEALRREIREELAIEIESPVEIFSHRHRYPSATEVSLKFFRVSRFEGDLRNRVFQQIRWVTVNELPTLDFLEGDLPLIVKLTGPAGSSLLD